VPTIFARLDAGMDGNDVSVRVDAQVGNLGTAVQLLTDLAQNPPDDVQDLLNAFATVPLPELRFAADVAVRFDEVRAALGGDPSALLSGIIGDLSHLETEFSGALGTQLADALVAIDRLHALTQLDFRCIGTAAGNGGGGEGGAGEGEEGGDEEGGGEEGGGADEGGSETSPSRATVARANEVLDKLPDPLTARGLLRWIHGGTVNQRGDRNVPPVIPIYDDLRDPVDTLVTWENATLPELATSLATGLTDAAGFIRAGTADLLEPIGADLAALTTSVPDADLVRIAERLTLRLTEAGDAVRAGNVGGTGAAVAEIDALLDEYEALRPGLAASLPSEAGRLRLRLEDLPDDLGDALAHVLSIVRPGGAVLANFPTSLATPALTELQQWLTGLSDWLQDVLGALDVEALRAPVEAVADTLRDVADGLDESIATLVVQVQALFGEVEALVASVNAAALTTAVTEAANGFRDSVVARIDDVFGPARAAIEQALGALDDAVESFDPSDIVDALADAADRVASVLQDPDVLAGIGAIRSAVEGAAAQIETLSFSPVTDQVIGVIEELTEALRAIDPAQLPPPATAALNAAVLILPSDLEPVTGPIVVDFGALIEAGPVPVLETVKAQPAKLLAHVQKLEPSQLVGDALSKPFQELVRKFEAFRPSALLQPLDAELASFRKAVLQAARPGKVLQPLNAPFAQVASALDALDPQKLTKPIDDALSDTVDRMLAVLPVQDAFDAIDAVLGVVNGALDSIDAVLGALRRMHGLLDAVASAPADVRAWVDEVLDRIEQIADTSAIDGAVIALRDAVDASRAAPVLADYDARLASGRATLDAIAGHARLASLVTAYRSVPRPALAALPDSPQKTALAAVLDRFDPLDPAFGVPYRVLGDLRQATLDARTAIAGGGTAWDGEFHAAGAPLTSLRHDALTLAQLRQLAQETLEAQLVAPLEMLFTFLAPALGAFGTALAGVEALAAGVRTRAETLLIGPDSIQGVRDALGAIVDRITSLDLDFVEDSLGGVFDGVRAQLAALAPATLAQPLDAAFAAVIEAIDLDALVPPAQVAALDATYASLIAKLAALDPGPIVVDAVQPIWDGTVLPLLEAFDIAIVIEALIEKLRSLDGELRAELGRVNDSYQELLAAVPAFELPIDIDIDIDVDIDVGF
jgi:hypothetical protein